MLIDLIIIIIIICEFIRRTVSASRLNLRRRQSLGGDDEILHCEKLQSEKLGEKKPLEPNFEGVISRGKSNFKR